MKKYLLVVILTFLIYYPLVIFGQDIDSQKKVFLPNIQFEERVYDFGIAGQQEKITHNYKFKNVGKGELVIKSVRAPCGCIATLVTSKRVPPGVTGVIKVTFETRKYKGKLTKSIFVYSNDPDEPKIELKISGVVKTDFALKPEFLHFGDVEKGETVTKTLKLIQVGQEQLTLNRVEAAREYFSTSISSFKDERHKGFKIDVSLKPSAPVGRLMEVITLHTNLKRHPRIDVPVWGNILGRIRVKPQRLSLGLIKKGSYSPKKIEVKATDQFDFKIVKVESNVPFLSTKVSEVKKSKRFEITLKVDKKAPAGRLRGQISIYTDDPDQALIKVPVYGLITN